MQNIEYAIAYSEVLQILEHIPREDYNKIPKYKIQMFEKNANKEYKYKFKYNPNMTLDEQNVSKRAKAIIAILFRDYWATEVQRAKIITKQKYDRLQSEMEKSEKCEIDNIFKVYNQRKERKQKINSNEMALVEYKEFTFRKIIDKAKRILEKVKSK